jgi:predicted transposase/invertase (TIGR01784 family)
MVIAEKRGKAEGKIEGRAEREREVARNLLASGVSSEIVAKSTDLSLDEIRMLMN